MKDVDVPPTSVKDTSSQQYVIMWFRCTFRTPGRWATISQRWLAGWIEHWVKLLARE